MSSPDEATTPTTGESATTPPPSSEMNAVPAEKAASKVPGSGSTAGAAGGKGSKASRGTPSMARTVPPEKAESADKDEGDDGDEKEGASGDESEYETICIRRKKPTPILVRLKRFLSNWIELDIYMASVMWEAFKLVIITSQFNWALEILAGLMHIFVAAGRCALKKECTSGGGSVRTRSDSVETEAEGTPEPEAKKSSVKTSSAMGKGSQPTGGSSVPKASKTPSKGGSAEETTTATGPTTTTETSTTESGEPKSTSEAPAGGEA